MLLLYNLSIKLYRLAIGLAAFRNQKAAAWIEGRKGVFEHLQQVIRPGDRTIWVHCSSAGEFEQGKPVIEALKTTYPAHKILVTFFSPSGYSVAKTYTHADLIAYLPLDTRQNAERFFKLVKPELGIFVKYEYWYHHLSVAAFHHIPLLLVSAVFRKEQVFFKPYGRFFRQMLHLFRHIFVQDQNSLDLLKAQGIGHCSISGDTRFDRVKAITASPAPLPLIEAFIDQKKVIVAGSTWPDDETVLAAYLQATPDVKLILTPHEINEGHIQQIQRIFRNHCLYSIFSTKKEGGTTNSTAPVKTEADRDILQKAQVLVIDSVGLLSRLYRYATLTYVGGGFTKDGIHNILEAAVWAKPVLFGPNFEKYREAKEMIRDGGAFSFTNRFALKKIADDLLQNSDHLQKASQQAKNYISENTGATKTIMQAIQAKRLLTN